MDIVLPYSHTSKQLQLPDHLDCTTLQSQSQTKLESLESHLDLQLESTLQHAVSQNGREPRSIAIAVPDETRPTPRKAILRVLLHKLSVFFPALKKPNISLVVGGGLHPPPTGQELKSLLPMDILEDIQIVAHDALTSPLTDFGLTSRNTPVFINTQFAQAELKIVIGQIDPHQFVGFTGGSKGVIIGTGGEKTIEHNHSLLFEEQARVGILEGNPVREDLNEAGRMVGIDLAVNVVLNPAKEVVNVFCGDPDSVLKKGAECCAQVYGVPISERFDIIIASCGGYPKDISLYQAQKGLNLASQALKPEGKILLLAACDQGIGDQRYTDYVSCFQSIEDAMTDFGQRPFLMGAHKCYLFGCTLTCHETVLHSELDEQTLKQCLLRGADAQETLTQWIESFPGKPRIGIVPYANTTYFRDSDCKQSESRK